VKTFVRLLIVVTALWSGVAVAQERVDPKAASAVTVKAEPPALSEIEKLKIDNLAKRLEIAQLKAQNAQADFDKARTEITQLVASLQKDGYELDLQTLTYKKVEPKK